MLTMFKKQTFLYQIRLRIPTDKAMGFQKNKRGHCCQGTCINQDYTICPEISRHLRTARGGILFLLSLH